MKYFFISLQVFFLFNISYSQFIFKEEYTQCILNNKPVNINFSDMSELNNYHYWDIYSEIIYNYRKNIIRTIKENNIDSLLYYTKNNFVRIEFKGRMDTISILKIGEEEILFYIQKKHSILLSNILSKSPCFQYSAECGRKADKAFFKKSFIVDDINNSLFIVLTSYAINHKDKLIRDIQKSDYKNYEKDFLILFLEYDLYKANMCNMNSEKPMLNLANKYIQNYPASEFTPFVKEVIAVEYKKSKWGFGAYCNSGVIFPTKNLANYFSSTIPISIGLELNYKRFYLNFLDLEYGLRNKILTNFSYKNTTWLKIDKASLLNGQFTFGYDIVKSKRINLIPYFGLIEVRISPFSRHYSLYYNNAKLIYNDYGKIIYGFAFDYKFGYRSCERAASLGRNYIKEENFGYLRLKFGYNNPKLQNEVSKFSGSLVMVNIGIGVYIAPAKKIKN